MTQRLDGNSVDMSSSPLYRKREAVRAFRLSEPLSLEKSWGKQEMQTGDWVTIDGKGVARGCEAQVFANTYELVPGTTETYRKTGVIRAQQMTEPFEVVSKDSHEPATGDAGDWLVQNGDDVADRYLIKNEKFADQYEPI